MDYHIYTLSDGADGHFVSIEEYWCGSDAQAVEYTRHTLNGSTKEVRQNGRLIERLTPEPKHHKPGYYLIRKHTILPRSSST